MAKATPRFVPRPMIPDAITLEITYEEAQALVSLLYRVGGAPDTTGRGEMKAVLEALEPHVPFHSAREAFPIDGRVMFYQKED